MMVDSSNKKISEVVQLSEEIITMLARNEKAEIIAEKITQRNEEVTVLFPILDTEQKQKLLSHLMPLQVQENSLLAKYRDELYQVTRSLAAIQKLKAYL